jgi:hypothetical protein
LYHAYYYGLINCHPEGINENKKRNPCKKESAKQNTVDHTLDIRNHPPLTVSCAPSEAQAHWSHFANEIQKTENPKRYISTIKAKTKKD